MEPGGVSKDSHGNHRETIDLHVHLLGEGDIKEYAEKEGPWTRYQARATLVNMYKGVILARSVGAFHISSIRGFFFF